MEEQDEKSLKIISEFLCSGHVFILDSPRSSRSNLVHVMESLGAQKEMIHEYDTMPEALNEYKKWNPIIILSDYKIREYTGFDFFRECRILDGGRNRAIFIIITSTLLQSVVAKAAEEDVDSYIIRPFSMNAFTNVLSGIINFRKFPSDYMKIIEEGKEFLIDKRYDLALEKFEKAMELDQTPSLACAYYAHVKRIFKNEDQALDSYMRGLVYNNIHYKCLRGLFELFMSHQRYEEAYEVARQLTRYFPTSDNILSSVIRLAIITKNFNHMEDFYETFKSLEFRDDVLVRYICAGMFVTGKYLIRHGKYELGIDLFEKISKTYNGKTKYLRAIIEALLEHNYYFLAYKYFGLFNVKEKFSKDYLVCSVLINYYNDSAKEDVIPKAIELINDQVESRLLFRKTLLVLQQLGEKDKFQQVMKKTLEIWPSFSIVD